MQITEPQLYSVFSIQTQLCSKLFSSFDNVICVGLHNVWGKDHATYSLHKTRDYINTYSESP